MYLRVINARTSQIEDGLSLHTRDMINRLGFQHSKTHNEYCSSSRLPVSIDSVHDIFGYSYVVPQFIGVQSFAVYARSSVTVDPGLSASVGYDLR